MLRDGRGHVDELPGAAAEADGHGGAVRAGERIDEHGQPATGLCNVGTATTVIASGSGQYFWSCLDLTSGTSATCQSGPAASNGVCGTANGQTLERGAVGTIGVMQRGGAVVGDGGRAEHGPVELELRGARVAGRRPASRT